MARKIRNSEIEKALKCELAKREFWEYCKLTAPDFYKEDRAYLCDICKQYQAFYESDEEILLLCAPPRHGKSRTATMFVQWVLGRYPKDKVVTGSYNETLSTVFSKGVRNKIQEIGADNRIVYHDIFPNTQVKRGDAAANLWGLVGNETNSYLATSPSGTVTGFGADLMLIDDIIKNEYEARNETIKEQHWRWFNDTMMSRREGKRKIIIVMTRWATDDLAGRLIADCDKRGKPYRLLSYGAFDGEKMLCDDILNREQYNGLLDSDTSKEIIEANYNQQPVDIVGRLYTQFSEYDEVPSDITRVDSYTDTADTGADYLCTLIYAVREQFAYVLDIIYTQEPMEVTEPLVARHLTQCNVNMAYIESNNGGRGFGRNVQRIAQKEMGNTITRFAPFTQTMNKQSRIMTNATGVMNRILFPHDWRERWSEYAKAMDRYQRTGTNKHDDAPDATTGAYEKSISKEPRKSLLTAY
jgi:predicted phage terminase large subunit-like protein